MHIYKIILNMKFMEIYGGKKLINICNYHYILIIAKVYFKS